ncbi:MAG TPA: SDR family oxidoreductase [Actinomycetota bacterium]|nr:SDR family oxidoreductase [Actinomycetota bacterium]
MSAQDLFSISGKVAVVTGGSRGIGLMIARGMVEAGATVYISSRKADVCDAVAAELSEIGSCVSIPADLSTAEGLDTLAGGVSEHEDRLHILVNNAGAAWGAPLEEYPEHAWSKVMDLNVKAIFELTRRLLPQLRAAATPEDPARVINIGSIDGLRVPLLNNYAYSASKAAVHMLTRHMAHHLVDDHITVNAIAPGLFPSKMTKFIFDNLPEEQLVGNIPMGRHGEPHDMAGTAIYLSSRAGSYLTGAVIPVDGGVSTR